MITKNFNIFKKVLATANATYYGNNNSAITVPSIKTTAGTSVNQIKFYNSPVNDRMGTGLNPFVLVPIDSLTYWTTDNVNNNNWGGGCSIWLGKSNADETENDYQLDAFTTSEISSTAFTCSRTITGDNIQLSFSRTFKNISGADITVKEVGFLHTNGMSSYYESGMYLFDRRKLPNEVTIADQAEHTFTMVYEF